MPRADEHRSQSGYIGGFLRVESHQALTSFQGLEALQTIGGYLSVFENNALTSFQGLEALQDIGEDIYVDENPALTSLTALHGLTAIGGATRKVRDNRCLPDAERDAFEAATGITFTDWDDNGSRVGTASCP